MNPPDQNQNLDPSKMNIPMRAMRPGEQVLFQIKRHPIGLFAMYFVAGFVILILAIMVFAVGPAIFPNNKSEVTSIGSVVFIIVLVAALIYAFIANKVYWGNSWTLTSDSITQVVQTSLFNKQSSQLALHNLEDVTAEQNGILTHMFNYGIIKAETAGERSKFTFLYAPDPNRFAQRILQARESFEQGGSYQGEHYKEAPQLTGSTQFPDSSRMSPQRNPGEPLPPQDDPEVIGRDYYEPDQTGPAR